MLLVTTTTTTEARVAGNNNNLRDDIENKMDPDKSSNNNNNNSNKESNNSHSESEGANETIEDDTDAMHFLKTFLSGTADSIIEGALLSPGINLDVALSRSLTLTNEELELMRREEEEEQHQAKRAKEAHNNAQSKTEETGMKKHPKDLQQKITEPPVSVVYPANTDKIEDRQDELGDIVSPPAPPPSDFSQYLQSAVSGTGGPPPPPLRDLEFYDQNFKISPDYNLHSAYFLSTPVESLPDTEYTRLVYEGSEIKRKDKHIFGGVIGGLTGVFGFLLSKKIIVSAVFIAFLMTMGLTGTTFPEMVQNVMRNFGIAYDLSVAVNVEGSGSADVEVAVAKDGSGASIDVTTGGSGSLGGANKAFQSFFQSQLKQIMSMFDFLVDLNFDYLGNSVGINVEGSGEKETTVGISFTPSEAKKKKK